MTETCNRGAPETWRDAGRGLTSAQGPGNLSPTVADVVLTG
jgi:hypothetical protein